MEVCEERFLTHVLPLVLSRITRRRKAEFGLVTVKQLQIENGLVKLIESYNGNST